MARAWLGCLLLIGCAESATSRSDAAIDTATADAATDIDASLGCVTGIPTITRVTVIQGRGNERVTAISPNPVDGTFVVAGYDDGDAFGALGAINGFHLAYRDGLVTAVRVNTSNDTHRIYDAFVDAHGTVTLGGTLDGAATIDGTPVAASPGTGLVVRDVVGLAPAIFTVPPSAPGQVWVDAVAPRGDGFYFAGSFTGTTTLDATQCVGDGRDSFIAALAFEGTYDWVRSFGGVGTQSLAGIAMHDAGDAYVVGQFTQQISIGGDIPAQPSRDGGQDAFVARFDGNGTPRWLFTLGAVPGMRWESGLARVAVIGDRVLAVGQLGGGDTGLAAVDPPLGDYDGVLVSLDLTGTLVRAVRVGGPGIDWLADIAADGCGRAWIIGAAALATPTQTPLVRSIDSQTLATEIALFEDATLVEPTAVAVANDGGTVLVAGHYYGSPVLAGTVLPTARGTSDLFFVTIERR